MEKIQNDFLVILSGKGGCGKTQVVSTVFHPANCGLTMGIKEEGKNGERDEPVRPGSPPIRPKVPFPQSVRVTPVQNSLGSFSIESPARRTVLKNEAEDPLDDMGISDDILRDDLGSPEMPLSVAKNAAQNGDIITHSSSKRCRDESLVACSPPKRSNTGKTPKSIKKKNSSKIKRYTGTVALKKQENVGKIVLTAPTGKAANLLGQRAGQTAFTLHQVVWSLFFWKKKCREKLFEMGHNYKEIDVKDYPKYELPEWNFAHVQV